MEKPPVSWILWKVNDKAQQRFFLEILFEILLENHQNE